MEFLNCEDFSQLSLLRDGWQGQKGRGRLGPRGPTSGGRRGGEKDRKAPRRDESTRHQPTLANYVCLVRTLCPMLGGRSVPVCRAAKAIINFGMC
jgi:hypothetical protein